MKFYAPVFFSFAMICLAVSCSKNNKEAGIEDEKPVVIETLSSGVVLSKKADLYLFGRDSAMHPIVSLSQGDNISVLKLNGVIDTKFVPDKTSSDESANPNPDGKPDENADNTEEVLPGTEYAHAVHDNVDFWIEKSVFALNCEKAAAIEQTFLYADPALTQKLDAAPNPLKFAAVIAKSADENAESKSAKIFYYDTAENIVREAFVSEPSISTRKDDIEVSRIAETLKTTKRAAPRNALFAEAAKYEPCQKVLAVLNAQKTGTKSYNYQEVLKSVQKMSFGVNVNELLTVDQSKDPFK